MRIVFALLSAVLAAATTTNISNRARAASPTMAAQQLTDPLPASCNPFGTLASSRPVDQACGLQGGTDSENGQKAQNRVKNNLCAYQNDDPATITRFTFDQLQQNTPRKQSLPWGSRTAVPASDAARMPLQDLYTTTNGNTVGEGSYVQFVAYILEGHFGGKESVNCNDTKRQNIDIHLALVTVRPSTLDLTNYDSECTSVTAELAPHRRPLDWDLLGRMTKTQSGQKLTGAQSKLADEDLRRPVRLRGQLMFDASHALCANGHRTTGNPARRSGWEIHPVYSIDVCNATTLATCQIDNDSRWTPLDQWLQITEEDN